ncbi:RING finger protein [Dickeya poaceiphila]|uniref:hypothetical protein n=1 Tax=Dickeya poaceiphila TaxID=568768 RepID=UPI0015D06CC5|nr:hypothetical protein [Dickeya poaceiphila]
MVVTLLSMKVEVCAADGVKLALKPFFHRYTNPVTGKLAQVKIGNFPQTSMLLLVLNSTSSSGQGAVERIRV